VFSNLLLTRVVDRKAAWLRYAAGARTSEDVTGAVAVRADEGNTNHEATRTKNALIGRTVSTGRLLTL
jgi:hypothetical protein